MLRLKKINFAKTMFWSNYVKSDIEQNYSDISQQKSVFMLLGYSLQLAGQL